MGCLICLFTFFVLAPSGFGALYWVADSNSSSSWLFRVLKQKRFDNFFCHPPIEIKGRSSEPHDVPCKKWPWRSTLRVASFESEATTGIQSFFSWCLEGRLFSFKCCSMLIPTELIFKSFFDWHGNGNENRTRYLLIAVYKRNRDKFIGWYIRLNAPYFSEQLHPFPNHWTSFINKLQMAI